MHTCILIGGRASGGCSSGEMYAALPTNEVEEEEEEGTYDGEEKEDGKVKGDL